MNKFLVLTCAAPVVVAACIVCVGAQEVHTDYDHNAPFRDYRTFSVYRLHASNQLVERRLRTDISQSLTARGLREVPEGGDLAITAIGSVRSQQEFTTFYNDLGPGWGYGGWGGWRGWGRWGGGGMGTATTSVYNIPVGTLAIDVYDAHTHQLVFRGTATDELSKHPEKNAKKVMKAVDKIFDKLPGTRKS